MTVKEYLNVLNNNQNTITMTGFIDIVPNIGDIPSHGWSETQLAMNGDNVIVKRTYYTDYGDITVNRLTPLNDDISLHCGAHGTPDKLIKYTIEGLLGLQQEMGEDVDDRITFFQNALDSIEQEKGMNR